MKCIFYDCNIILTLFMRERDQRNHVFAEGHTVELRFKFNLSSRQAPTFVQDQTLPSKWMRLFTQALSID